MNLNIKNIWEIEQEILDVFHDICIRNNLKYSIAYGTLLGAVRHGGFIPWDDDIDVIMPREDYEKLSDIWNESAPKGFIFQDYHSDKHYLNNFAKIRKDNTTFIQFEEEKNRKYHKGIFIDVFPVDRVPKGRLRRNIQKLYIAVNLLYSHGYSSGSKGIVGYVEKVLLKCSDDVRIKRRNKSEMKIKKYNGKSNAGYVSSCTIMDCNYIYPCSLFDNLSTISFNGKEYCCVYDVQGFLTYYYGDYMKLPPKNERVWKHHPILVDYEHNYEDIK